MGMRLEKLEQNSLRDWATSHTEPNRAWLRKREDGSLIIVIFRGEKFAKKIYLVLRN